MKLITFIITLVFITQISYSQEQNSNWYFGGNNGIGFETNSSSSINGGQIASSNTPATVSDSSGNLLFYTDGKSVWNKNHRVMNNTLLSSNTSPYESAIILPMPNSNKYYIFTQTVSSISGEDPIFVSFYFSIVNMDANNGLGSVEVLNRRLIGSESPQDYDSFQMTSALHFDQETYWLILKLNNNDFYSFHITENELRANPNYILSSSNSTNTSQKSASSCDSANPNLAPSYLKTSKNSDKLASFYTSNSACLAGSWLNVYDFNNATGEVGGRERSDADYPGYISLDFSPNGEFIYILNTSEIKTNLKVFKTSDPTEVFLEIPIDGIEDLNYPNYGNFLQRGVDGNLYFVTNNATKKVSILKNADNPFEVEIIKDYLTFNNNVDQFPYLIPYQSCLNDFFATVDIVSGTLSNKSTQNTITATNTINSSGTANYDAGTTVFLKPGFHAKLGAKFRGFIEGCSATSARTTETLEKQENTKEAVVLLHDKTTVYPNPTNGIFTISSNEAIIDYNVFNSLGTMVLNEKVHTNKMAIDIQNLPEGMYIVRVVLVSGEVIMKKIIKN